MDIFVFFIFISVLFYQIFRRKIESLGFIIFFQEIILLFFQNRGLSNYSNYFFIFIILLFSLFNYSEIKNQIILRKFFSIFFLFYLLFISSFLFQILYRGFFSDETYILFNRYFTQVFPLIVFILFYFNDYNKLNNLLKGVLIYGFFFYLMLMSTYDISSLSSIERKYFREEVGLSPIQLSRLSGFISIVVYFFILKSRKFVYKLVLSVFLLIPLYFLILGESRGPFIFLFLSLSVSYFIVNGISKRIIYFSSALVLFLIVLYYLFPQFSLFLVRFNEFQDYESMLRFKRLEFFVDNAFDVSVFLFGIGPGGFNFKTSLSYPHNLFVELYLEYGVFGLLFFIQIIFLIIKGVFLVKKINIDFNFLCLFTVFIFFFLSALVSGDLIGNRSLFFILFLLFSYYTSLSYLKRNTLVLSN